MHMSNLTRVTGWMGGTIVALGLLFAVSASAADLPSASGAMDMTVSGAMHDMSMHQTMSSGPAVSTWHTYLVPALTLINQHGEPISLKQVLTSDRPVLVQFFYASCTTICGVRAAQLVSIAKKLVKADIDIGFYTITTDPDRDTPSRLLSYSQEFGPPPVNWQLMTGTLAQTRQMQMAFEASDPANNRMFHRPETFIRAGKNGKWLRIDGMTTALQLENQIKMVVASAR
ncbi:MAG: SCO family protein [Rhodanobacter sp.]